MRTWNDLLQKVDKSLDPDTLTQAINNLPEPQQMVLTRHYSQRQSFRSIAQECNLTAAKISNLHTRALHTLRMQLSATYSQQLQDAVAKVVMPVNF